MNQKQMERNFSKNLKALGKAYPDAEESIDRSIKAIREAERYLADDCKVRISASVPLYDAELTGKGYSKADTLAYEPVRGKWRIAARFARRPGFPVVYEAMSKPLKAIVVAAAPRLLSELYDHVVSITMIADAGATGVENKLSAMKAARGQKMLATSS